MNAPLIWPKAPTRARKVRKLAEIDADLRRALKVREELGAQLVRLARRYGIADGKVRKLTREMDRTERLLIEAADAANELARLQSLDAAKGGT